MNKTNPLSIKVNLTLGCGTCLHVCRNLQEQSRDFCMLTMGIIEGTQKELWSF